MSSQADLLRQLSIDRSGNLQPRPAPKWPWVLAAVLLAGAAAAYFFKPDGAVPVRLVMATVKGGTPLAGSVLDASGYVVARRQATVSSKITGKVMSIHFEEGQRVQEGEVLARLDSSNLDAQMALGRAQVEQARAQLTELQVALANAERDAARNRDLVSKKLVPQSAADNADTAAAQLKARLASASSRTAPRSRAGLP